MTPINTGTCNVLLTSDSKDEETLPAKVDQKKGIVETYWEPSVEERVALAYGANVRLVIHAFPIPPVSVEVSYVGRNGFVVFYEDTLDKAKLAEKLDEAVRLGQELKKDMTELARRYERCRDIAECPKGTDLEKRLGVLRNAELIIQTIRKVSGCPDGASLVRYIEEMKEAMEEMAEADLILDEDDDDIEDDDDDDWWKRKQEQDEEE